MRTLKKAFHIHTCLWYHIVLYVGTYIDKPYVGTYIDNARDTRCWPYVSYTWLCSRDGKICCYGDALSTIFLLAFVTCFLLFAFCFSFLVLIFFRASRYVYLLRVPSSVQQPSATVSRYVFCSTCFFCLCHLYPTPSRNSFVFFIRLVFLFS